MATGRAVDPLIDRNSQQQDTDRGCCGSKCCCYFDVHKKKQFFLYTIINAIRFLGVGILIYYAHHRNIEEHENYKEYCCDCYYISLNTTAYADDVAIITRFDLSYCMPLCTDCTHCDTYFENSAQRAFDYNGSSCPMDGYPGSHTIINWPWGWYEDTGCHNDLSLIGFLFVLKSYRGYGSAAFIICFLYCTLLILFVISECTCFKGSIGCFFRMMLIYNFMLSELCFYFLFKAYQYWSKTFIGVGVNLKSVTCPIASTDQSVRSALITMIVGAMILALMHLIFECIDCCICCEWCKCCKCCRQIIDDVNQYELRRLKRTMSNTASQTDDCQTKCICIQFWFGIILLLWLFIFFIILFIAIFQMMTVLKFAADHEYYAILLISAMVLNGFTFFGDILFCGVAREILVRYYRTVKRQICQCCKKASRNDQNASL